MVIWCNFSECTGLQIPVCTYVTCYLCCLIVFSSLSDVMGNEDQEKAVCARLYRQVQTRCGTVLPAVYSRQSGECAAGSGRTRPGVETRRKAR